MIEDSTSTETIAQTFPVCRPNAQPTEREGKKRKKKGGKKKKKKDGEGKKAPPDWCSPLPTHALNTLLCASTEHPGRQHTGMGWAPQPCDTLVNSQSNTKSHQKCTGSLPLFSPLYITLKTPSGELSTAQLFPFCVIFKENNNKAAFKPVSAAQGEYWGVGARGGDK